jgi:hypothetical protein
MPAACDPAPLAGPDVADCAALGGAAEFASAGQAVAMIESALSYLAERDAADLTFDEQAGVLRGLERVSSRLVAARSRVLKVFVSAGGLAADGQGSARGWLVWQSRVTRGAAGGAVGWLRRLGGHPVLEQGLAAGELSESWTRQLADWTDKLPEGLRQDADQILSDAAAGGADLADLAGLAREMRERTAEPDRDSGRGFDDRRIVLERTYEGAGRLGGDLTPECAAALSAVLESLGKRAGPEDTRSRVQRDHDALEEACRRLVSAGCLPEVAGQPVLVQLHMALGRLAHARGGTGAGAAARGTGGLGGGPGADGALTSFGLGGPDADADADDPVGVGLLPEGAGWLSGAAAEAYACDARVAPVVSGRIDPAALAWMVHDYLGAADPRACQVAGCADQGCRARRGVLTSENVPSGHPCPHTGSPGWPGSAAEPGSASRPGAVPGPGSVPRPGSVAGPGEPVQPPGLPAWPPGVPLPPGMPEGTATRLGDSLARYAIAVLSGPGGLASVLRQRAGGPAAVGVSLPLDTGTPTPTVPPHLRRAVTARDRHCAFPGCAAPPAACQVHHVRPRSEGGITALHNLALLCSFHHLIAVHRWGWALALNADGTTTATSPDGTRTLHSHSPPLVA